MNSSLPLTEARDILGGIVNRVALRGERVTITKNGKDVAVIVPLADVELLRDLEDRVDLEEARVALAEARKKGMVPWKKIKAELGL